MAMPIAAPLLDDLRATVRTIADRVSRLHRDEVDAAARWPAESLAALGEAGLLGLVVPRQLGGHGAGMSGLAAACEELGRVCPSSALTFGMHCVASAVIAAKATPDQQQRLLAPILAGRHVTTLALSEAGSGSHFYVPATRLRAEGDAFEVQGRKHFVTSASHADSWVISARAGGEEEAGRFSCLVVERGTPGVRIGEPWNGLGMRGNDSRAISFEGARVPRNNLLGEEGDQSWYVFEVVSPYFLVAMSGTYLGLARAIFDEALAHLRRRRHDHAGTSLADVQVLQHRVGELYAALERSRQLVFHAARVADAGDPEALAPIFAAKADVAEMVVHLANEAMTLCGGLAYGENALLARFLRDARAAHVMAPTTDVLKVWAGRFLLGLPLL